MKSNIRNSFGARRRVSGITLVELIVAVSGLVLIMGITYNIYEATRNASIKMIERQAALDYGVMVVDATTQLLNSAIHPDDLDIEIAVGPSFSADALSVHAYPADPTQGLKLVTISTSEDGGLVRTNAAVEKATGEGALEETSNGIGTAIKGFTPKVSFRYATSAEAGSPVEYVDSLSAGQWPVLIEITVTSELPDRPGHPVRLKTAVIPGRLPRS